MEPSEEFSSVAISNFKVDAIVKVHNMSPFERLDCFLLATVHNEQCLCIGTKNKSNKMFV